MPSPRFLVSSCALRCAFLLLAAAGARADLAADYAALTAGVQGQSATLTGGSIAGGVAPFGAAAFPVLLGTVSPVQAVMAAGRHGDSYAAGAARAVAWSHTGFFDTAGGVRTTLFANSVLWASRQAAPAGTIAVVVNNSAVGTYLTGLGYTVRSATATITAANLAGAHVLVLSGNTDYPASAMAQIASFTAGGGGVAMSGTPWAASSAALADSHAILDPFGLVMNPSTADDSTWAIPAAAYPAIQSALPAADALIADREGTAPLSLADRTIAANAIFQVVSVRIDIAALKAKLDVLGDAAHYGTIAPTLAAPIVTAQKPVEKMLARYQSQIFDTLTPAQLFVHPCAADFPGAVQPGATTVSKTVPVNGNTPADFYMNHGERPTRVETGLYAAPGATITVTIPAGLIGQGLLVHISPNGSEDQTWNGGTWTFFPKLWRRVALTQAATQTGHVLGGLVTILVPEGKTLGTFNVTIDGAIEAPAFTLGETTDAQWLGGVRTRPAPYGYVQSGKFTLYLPRPQLASLDNASQVVGYWRQVMDLADEYYGYTPYRKRAETNATARYVSAGAAYANYPIESGWGTTYPLLLHQSRAHGSWGTYHELGHNYQNIFDSAFVIAVGAEVDVNLFPGLIYARLHDRTAWDGPTHGTYDGTNRAVDRAAFLALPAAEQTWSEACSRTTGYDFYFNLAEAFGWEVYRTALGRLMTYLQAPSAATDAELHALSSSDPNFRRNRFYLLLCDAAGRNLDAYFQRYGIGVAGKGHEITAGVKTQVAAKGYAVWTDNTAIDALSAPAGALSVSEDAAPGAEVYRFVATDAEEPGQIYDFAITAGNTNGAFSIDRRSGRLRVQRVDAETLASYTLTVQAQDSGVPRFAATQMVTVNVTGAAEAPRIEGRLFTATSAMGNGTSLGSVIPTLEAGRTLASYTIIAGNPGNFSLNPTTGALTVSNAATLPSPGVIVLTLRATDSAGATGFGYATILCNRATGVLEERWSGDVRLGAPTSTSTFASFTSGQNVANTYQRRVSGWLVPAKSGAYTFWIAGDDDVELALSTDETAANHRTIAAIDSGTAFQQWTKSTIQKSAAIFLQAGRGYAIEALHREAAGGDHVSVAWAGPGIAQEVIPTSVLIPRDATANFPPSLPAPSVIITTPEEGAYLFTPGTFPIAASVSDHTLTISKVQFFDGATLIGEDASAPYSVGWTNPATGPHTLLARVVHSAGAIDSNGRAVTVAPAGAPVAFITDPRIAQVAIPPAVGLVLEATVADDTPASLTVAWSKVSGPGTVTFGNAAAANSTAHFSAAGLYVLRLTASDGAAQTTDEVTVNAGFVPATFLNADVSSPRPGAGSNDGGIFTVAGAGADIYDTSDQFHFYYVQMSGDFDFRARLVSKTVSAIAAHTALMARASLAAGSIHVSTSQEGGSTNYLMQRATTGGSTTIGIGGNIANSPPTWLRLARSGANFTGYVSDDGVNWTARGPVASTLPATVLLGFAVSNADSSASAALNVATFDNMSGFTSGAVAATVAAGADQTPTTLTATLAGSATDDGQPAPPGALTTRWVKVSGPGAATFANAASPATSVTFSQAGAYMLRLLADDGAATTFDDVTLTTPTATQLWRDLHFGANAGNDAIAGPNADPNKNGLVNRLEYIFGSDPNAPGAAAPWVASLTGNRLTITFPHNTAATDATVLVEANDTLTGAWTELARSVGGGFFTPSHGGATVVNAGAGAIRTITVQDYILIGDPQHPRRFVHVKVTP